MPPVRTTLRRLSALLAASLLSVVPTGAAEAHTTDPRLVASIDAVTPPLPQGVTVEVVPGVANEIIVANRTGQPLVAFGRSGDPLVRVSTGDVEANVATPDWYIDNDPAGAGVPPARVEVGAHPRWVRVSAGDSYGWFDPRLYPTGPVPAAVAGSDVTVPLTTWSMALRYGGRQLTVAGHVAFRPVVGSYQVAVTSAPDALVVDALQGRLPGLFVSARTGEQVVIDDASGGPFLRFADGQVTVNTGSPAYVADRQARGLAPSRRHGWALRGRANSASWLDPRLLPPVSPPAHPSSAADVRRWAIPVRIGSRAGAITGVVRWVPASTPLVPEDRSRGVGGTVAGAVAALTLLVGVGAHLAVRRRRRDGSGNGRTRGRADSPVVEADRAPRAEAGTP